MSPSTIERIIYLRHRQGFDYYKISMELGLHLTYVKSVCLLEEMAIQEMKQKSMRWIEEDPELAKSLEIKYGTRVKLSESGMTHIHFQNRNRHGTFIRYTYNKAVVQWDGVNGYRYLNPQSIQPVSPIGKAV